ncbi:MAG: rod shape-determining protein RodA [Thiohalospira sp.]
MSQFEATPAGSGSLFSARGLSRRLHLDIPLLVALLAMLVAGIFIIYSAGDKDINLVMRHSARIFIGLVALLVLAQIPPDRLRRWLPWAFLAGLLLLVLVMLLGGIGKGAQRWLDLGFIRFQPSEIMKLAVPGMVAVYLAREGLPPRFAQTLVALAIIAVPTLLVVQQPDLGTGVLIAFSGFVVLLLGGLRWHWMVAGLTAILAAIPFIWSNLHSYQQDRVLTFLNPENDPLGSGYHIVQSKIAIGSGGLHGKGWLNGSQAHLEFLPERSTDFIFAVFAEEFGFIGGTVLLTAYAFIILRALYIAYNAQDTFGRLFAASIALSFFIYVFVNIGMVMGLMPVVGLPLPLISYGGSSLVTLIASFGILMAIHNHRRFLIH